ncbi:cupin domain-containing protein [Phenylobacterium sp.]|uniref:cupin domain-containing protein n=1 Tax=Phenylobacterium sp. TaxID=1871053 RepID=UPI002FCBE73B
MFSPLAAALAAVALQASPAAPAAPMTIVREQDVMRRETPPPHGGVGESTAYRLSDQAPRRAMEFRKRVLHAGASIGLHVLTHDEVYYVLEGEGEVTSDGDTRRIRPRTAAYLYEGANVGIRQVGGGDLVLLISYPLKARTK